MDYPKDLKYTKSHEWVRPKDGAVVVGITDFAQHELSDVVYIELPESGSEVSAGKACAVVESVKAASDIYAPVSGRVGKVNDRLRDHPEIVNTDPYGEGWLFEIEMTSPDELKDLLDEAAYRKQVEAEKEEGA